MEHRSKQGLAHRAKETALDVAVGGPALAVDKAGEVADEVARKGERVIRQVRDVAADATGQAAEAVEEDADTRPYEERTRDELYRLAADRQIAGRSSMRKAELIEALRADR